MNATYGVSLAICWTITAAGWMWMRHWRLKLRRATMQLHHPLDQMVKDADTAEWCRHMSLTVITVSGAVFSTTFAELQASEVPMFRNWHVPTQVTVWSDQAEDILLAAVPARTGLEDA